MNHAPFFLGNLSTCQTHRCIILTLSLIWGFLLPGRAQPAFPTPTPPDTTSFGRAITRTMHLLATSTPKKRNAVKILVYGQSVSRQDWWLLLKQDLEQRFPHADLVMENRAIGGFAVPLLNRTAEHDVYSFSPDLVIFHVYGGEPDYEALIREIRTRTTAEIAIHNDHVGLKQDEAWHNRHSFEWLPNLCQRYGLEMMDIRRPWRVYLENNHLRAKDLLSDDIHLNAQGNFLLASLIKPHLVYRPELPPDPYRLVTTYEVGKDVKFKNGTLILPFTGNRVDLIAAAPGKNATAASVWIDGQKPSQFPGCYALSRANDRPEWPWEVGAPIRVGNQKPLVLEDWIATITRINARADTFDFTVQGSVTGFDGSGTSTRDFVSNSGRVVLEARDWFMQQAVEYSKITLPVGYQLKWSVIPLFRDRYEPTPVSDATREQVTTVAQGLSNQPHTLQLQREGWGLVPIRYIRVYRPARQVPSGPQK